MPVVKPTRTEIDEQAQNLAPDGHLTPEDRADAIDVVTQWADWDESLRSQLDKAVVDAVGYQAQRILAALANIDALGKKSVELQVTGLITRRKGSERADWVRYIVAVLRIKVTSNGGGASAKLADLGGRRKLWL